jgi:hypothetical protein
VAEGLKSPDVLKVKRAKRVEGDGVDPDLPQELVNRLIKLPSEEK